MSLQQEAMAELARRELARRAIAQDPSQPQAPQQIPGYARGESQAPTFRDNFYNQMHGIANPQEGVVKDTRNFLGELAASSNRSLTEFIDFIGPDTANSLVRLASADWSKAPTNPLAEGYTKGPDSFGTLTGALEPTGIRGNFMDEGYAKEGTQALGTALSIGGGLKSVARDLTKAPGIAAELMGFGSAKAPMAALSNLKPNATPLSQQALDALPAPERALIAGEGDTITAKVMLDPSAPLDAPKAIKDKVGTKAVKQGFDEGLVAMVKELPPKARKKITRMVDIVEKNIANFRHSYDNRPLDIAGDSIVTRHDVVRKANRDAGEQIDAVAKTLRGQPVDMAPAYAKFRKTIEDMDIQFNLIEPEDGPPRIELGFKGSEIEGLPGIQRVLKNVFNRIQDMKAPDAYAFHKLKRIIDEQVTYGRNARGLSGKTEKLVKDLRHHVDEILDQNFPEYNAVNTQYAETIDAIDTFQEVAGKKMDLDGEYADEAIGTLMRRLLSNAQSRIPLKYAAEKLDAVARKYSTPNGKGITHYNGDPKRIGLLPDDFDDDIAAQVMFVDELEKMFGASARTSLQGDIEKATRMGAAAATQGPGVLAVEALVAGGKKAQGINKKNAIKSIRELLKETK